MILQIPVRQQITLPDAWQECVTPQELSYWLIAKFETFAGEQDDKIDAIDVKVNDLTIRVNGQTDDIQNLTRRTNILSDYYDQLNSDVTTLKTDVSTLKTDVSSLQTDVSTLKTDVSSLQTDVSTLKTDVSTLKTDADTAKTEIASLRQVHGQLLETHGQAIATLQQQIKLVPIYEHNLTFSDTGLTDGIFTLQIFTQQSAELTSLDNDLRYLYGSNSSVPLRGVFTDPTGSAHYICACTYTYSSGSGTFNCRLEDNTSYTFAPSALTLTNDHVQSLMPMIPTM